MKREVGSDGGSEICFFDNFHNGLKNTYLWFQSELFFVCIKFC
jgi:hypothetical protein